MAKFTFLRVLGSNLKCAVCKKKDCPVRYYPERRKIQYCDGTRYVTGCEKDRQKHIEKSLKRPLPWYLSTHKMYHPNRVVHFVYAIILYFLLKKYKTYVKLKSNKSNYIKRALLCSCIFSHTCSLNAPFYLYSHLGIFYNFIKDTKTLL